MIPDRVECHSGYKADEYPKTLHLADQRHGIDEIIDRWYQYELSPEYTITDYFKVETDRGGIHLLKHDRDRR